MVGQFLVWELPHSCYIRLHAVVKLKSRTINLALKGGVALLFALLLYWEMRHRVAWQEVGPLLLQQFRVSQWPWITAAMMLVPVNWWCETQKWYPFIRRFEPIGWWMAFRAVLSGVSFSLFTPNRIGEYGGRVLYVKPQNRWKAVIVNLVGNFSQYLVLVSMGTLGAIYHFPGRLGMEALYVRSMALVAVSGVAVLFLVYFNIRLVIPLARKLPLIRYIKPYVRDVRVLEHFTRSELWQVLRWSIVRYAIYSTQYFLILRFFEVNVSVLPAYAAIAAIFLVQTSLPLPPAASLMARGNLALHIWGEFGAGEVKSLAVTFSLWIINLIIPALIGTFSFFYVNITKQIGYEDD